MMGQPGSALLRGRLLRAVLLAVVMLSSLGLYLAVEYWRGQCHPMVTQTAWDRHIPFWPGWVWVYLFPYLLAPLLAAAMSWDTLLWYLKRGIATVLISVLIFAVLPTCTVRPERADQRGSGPTAQLYRNMIAIDGPAANAAPSLHVSLTALLACALLRDYRRAWQQMLIGVGVALVWLSTLFTWQHHLIDVGTGALLGIALAYPWRPVSSQNFKISAPEALAKSHR